jgi:DNA-binding PadR family transcriptional regulator
MGGNDWPTRAEMLVMHALQRKPRGAYGLQIVEESDGEIKRGSVYVLLGRLEEKGYVKSDRQTAAVDHAGPARPLYRLTGEGTRVLAAAEAIGLNFVGAQS